MPELVSILIPAYNAEQWIAETINSGLAQTWPNKEIIIVNDGSSDNTYRLAKQFESKMVKVVTQPNIGAAGARNKALSLAQGSYIQWLDADDLLHPEKIILQLREAESGINSRILLTCAWGKFFYRYQKAKFAPDSLWQNLSAVSWIMKKFMDNVWMNPAVWLVSRRLADLAGPWDERLSISGDDDGEYICRVVAASEDVKFVPEAQCYYRIGNTGSLSMAKAKSEKTLEALFLSISLSIRHILLLENSQRTRIACVKYLQNRFGFFYPKNKELIEKVQRLAEELGGCVLKPNENWRFHLVENMIGWNMAMRIKNILWVTETMIVRKWDELFYKISNG